MGDPSNPRTLPGSGPLEAARTRKTVNTAFLRGAVVVGAIGVPALVATNAAASAPLYCQGVHNANSGCSHTYRNDHQFKNNSGRNENHLSMCIQAHYGNKGYGYAHCVYSGAATVSHLGSASALGWPTPLIGRCWNGGAAGGTSIHCRDVDT